MLLVNPYRAVARMRPSFKGSSYLPSLLVLGLVSLLTDKEHQQTFWG